VKQEAPDITDSEMAEQFMNIKKRVGDPLNSITKKQKLNDGSSVHTTNNKNSQSDSNLVQ